MNQPVQIRRGYAYVMLAAVLWAVSGSAAKYLFQHGVTPFGLVQLRLTIAAAALLAWLAVRHPSRLRIARQDVGYFAVYGLLGMAACQFTYLLAISRIKVAAAILLQYLAPSFIAAHAVLFARERLSLPTGMALAGATAGCYLVVGAYDLELLSLNAVGVGSGILSAILFAWCSVHGEYGMRLYHPWTVLVYGLAFGAAAWNVALPPLQAFFQPYGAHQWGWILYIGLFGTLAPFGLYLAGINLIRSTRASITAVLEPITAGAVAYLFLGEAMTPLQIAGGILVIGSIVALQLDREHDAKTPAALRAQTTAPRSRR